MTRRTPEHAFVVHSSPLPADWPTFSPHRMAEELSTRFAEIADGLDASLSILDGGGWDAISHNTTLVHGTLIVSFLIRRDREHRA